ncbi:MAG: DHHW family protein [Bacilli bacterium]
MNRQNNKILAIAFASSLVIGGVSLVFLPKHSFSKFENRNLASFPELTKDSVIDGSFTSEFETYIQDHFPVRNAWISSKTKLDLVREKTFVQGVHVTDQDIMLENLSAPDKEDLERSVRLLTSFRERISGVPFKVVYTPNKNVQLVDQYPSYIDYGWLAENKKQMVDTLESKNVDVIDLSGAGFFDETLYFKTDHHWNGRGAQKGFALLSDALGHPFKQPTQVALDGEFMGSLNRKLFGLKDESEQLSVPRYDNKNIKIETDYGPQTWDEVFFTKPKANERWTYENMYMDNLAMLKSVNKNAPIKEKIIVIKDSFVHAMMPHFVQQYEEVVMVDSRWYRMQFFGDLVDSEKPDSVLFIVNDGNLTGESYTYLR